MKKIIALAVAGAFVAPVYAADVTVSGAVEYQFTDEDGVRKGETATQDIKVSATEDLGNGMTVTAFVSIEGADGANDAQDSLITLTGGFGTLTVGDDGDSGYNAFDNKSDVAEAGGDTAISAQSSQDVDNAVQFMPNIGIDGLSFAVGYSAADASGEEVSGFGVQYATGGLAISYGSADRDDEPTDATHVSVSFATGPFYVGVDSYDDQDGDDGKSVRAIGATYDYGNGKLYYESDTTDPANAAHLDLTDTIVGVSYKIGAVNTYIQTENTETGTTAITGTDKATVGIEYAF
jgi:hypothetical protein